MIYENGIIDGIGNTPIVRVHGILPERAAKLYIKMEGFNPCGSVKDRPALNMISQAEVRGDLQPGGTVVESTSGNLGTALAMICAQRGYRCIVVVDPRTSQSNIAMMRAFGAEVDIVTEKNPNDGTYQEARIKRAADLAQAIDGAFMPWQYGNPDNPEAHVKNTAQELLTAFPAAPECVVAAVSTGGQVSGIGRGLKDAGANTSVIGVDVEGSVVFGGQKSPTAVTGMGLGWVPDNLDESVIDVAYKVQTELCFTAVRLLAKNTGILLGGSSGASLVVAMKEAMRRSREETVISVCADRGDKYLDEFYCDNWMRKKGLNPSVSLSELLEQCRNLTPYRYPASQQAAA